MSGYLYFFSNLKDIKDHIQAHMVICKIFFQLLVTFFKEKLNLQLPLRPLAFGSSFSVISQLQSIMRDEMDICKKFTKFLLTNLILKLLLQLANFFIRSDFFHWKTKVGLDPNFLLRRKSLTNENSAERHFVWKDWQVGSRLNQPSQQKQSSVFIS